MQHSNRTNSLVKRCMRARGYRLDPSITETYFDLDVVSYRGFRKRGTKNQLIGVSVTVPRMLMCDDPRRIKRALNGAIAEALREGHYG